MLDPSQFVDLCILLGCDYCGTIKGIGPKRAIDLIKQHGSIEEILDNLDPKVGSPPVVQWSAGTCRCLNFHMAKV
jgi:flap endonuclease-1